MVLIPLNTSDTLQVHGTPASGKTTLTRLLAQHILQQEPAVQVISVSHWPLIAVNRIGGWKAYLQHIKGWIQDKRAFFIFDEAHETYGDFGLWSEFFKHLYDYPHDSHLFAIAFTKYYGSPTSCPTSNIQNAPFSVNDSQRVTLRHIDHGDGFSAVGLLFTPKEFVDLVCKQFSPPENYFDSSFFKAVFDVTGGHVGAILGFVMSICRHDVRLSMMLEHVA